MIFCKGADILVIWTGAPFGLRDMALE